MRDDHDRPGPAQGDDHTRPRGGGRPRFIFSHDHHSSLADQPVEFDLLPGVSVIGSHPEADLHLPGLSEQHAEVRRDAADEYVLVHLGAPASSTVNGSPVTAKALHTGDRVQLGAWTLSFYREEYADHGRPHGGRVGGERFQRPQDAPRPERRVADRGQRADGPGPGRVLLSAGAGCGGGAPRPCSVAPHQE